MTRSYTDRIWYRDDVTPPQKEALRRLRDAQNGTARVVDLRQGARVVRLSTLRSLHRFGLVRTSDDEVTYQSTVTITDSGRESIADSATDQFDPLAVACPFCEEGPGETCRTTGHHPHAASWFAPCAPHMARMKAAAAALVGSSGGR